MYPVFYIHVRGVPRPQGSKRMAGSRMIEASKYVADWRTDVCDAAFKWREANGMYSFPPKEALHAKICFAMPRPQSHYSGKGVTLRPGAPEYVTKTPDLDKLLRATFDGLVNSRLLRDDALIVTVFASKSYEGIATPPGAHITIKAAP